jgi:hypothetical protein
MTDLTMDAICSRHPGNPSTGFCDRCRRSYCGECRVEDVAADGAYCSEACRDSDPGTEGGARATDDVLLRGYDHPIGTGARNWARSLRSITAAAGPLAGFAMIFTLLSGGFAGETVLSGALLPVLAVVGLFGAALTGVVTSRSLTGHAPRHVYVQTLERFVPWLVTWLLMIGITILGYVLLVIPGIYLNLRIFWADEFALAHRVSPFKALDESWQISRGEVGKTFMLEWVLGWIGMALVLAVVLPLGMLFAASTTVVPRGPVMDGIFAGLAGYCSLIAYSLLHSMQISLFYALRARYAKKAETETARRMPRLLQWAGVPAAVLVCLIAGLVILAGSGATPSDRVLAGDNIPRQQYEALVDEQIIGPDEAVEYFYSEGILSVLEGGSVLTDRRLVVYEQNDGVIDVYELYFDDISAVELVQQGDLLQFSIYRVLSADEETWLHLWLPHEFGDDKTFVAAVEAKLPH